MSKPPVRPNDEDNLRINEQIRIPQIRLIDENGEMFGLTTPREALEKARAAGLDLVEISPGASPPVCKILDYGKFKYEQQKRKAEARKKQKVIEVKELRLRPMIGDHDFEVKINAAKRFLEDGDKVKFVVRFRGRELSNQQFGSDLMKRVQEDLADLMKVESEPKLEGKQMIMVIGPK